MRNPITGGESVEVLSTNAKCARHHEVRLLQSKDDP